VLADNDLLAQRARALKLSVRLRDYVPGRSLQPEPDTLNVEHHPLVVPSFAGKPNPANASSVLAMLERGVDGCIHGEFSALITAPVHKGVINQAGVAFSGHTEYLAAHTGAQQPVMLLTGEPRALAASMLSVLRVALATTHMPLSSVPAAINIDRLRSVLRVLHEALVTKYATAAPRILVAGLNPHAGEGGHLGREEIEVILPALDSLRAEGMLITGPLPADTLFTPLQLARADAVLAMYHDQGLAVVKHTCFGRSVNTTLGLPIIRTSVDHGAALDIAGQGLASADSLLLAVAEAERMAVLA